MIELTHDEEFAVLTIRRPTALNALSFELIGKIGECIREAGRSSARALIITGEGEKAFCAGADIKELQQRGLAAQREGAELGQAVFAQLDRLPIPSVALVNGYAFGGGLELALACDFRIAAEDAELGLPEIKLGMIPGSGGTQRLARLIGLGRAKDAIMRGRRIPADEALSLGLVTEVVPVTDLDQAVERLVDELRALSPLALAMAKRVLNHAYDGPLALGLEVEGLAYGLLRSTADFREGVEAFDEKRPPRFTGR
jgi:enoyl-CoA hydratase